MLPRPHRLQADADIKTVLRLGRLINTPWIRVYILARPANTPARFTCIVGKKVHPLSTGRHRYQRWLREYARSLLTRLLSSADVVIVAQPPLRQLTSLRALRHHLKSLPTQLDKALSTGDN